MALETCALALATPRGATPRGALPRGALSLPRRCYGAWRPLFMVVVHAAALGAQAPSADAPLALEEVTVVNVQDGRLVPKQTVVVVGNRIHAVGTAGRVRLLAGARRVNGRGKYLMPGLWDMHVHVMIYPQTFYPLFIANGVTGIREMAQPLGLDSLHRWRREIMAGERVGPRIVGAGALIGTALDAKVAHEFGLSHYVVVSTPDDGRRVVDSLKAAGADFIKVHGFIAREAYFALAAEARRVGIPVVGHLARSVTAGEASDSGQRSIEHYFGFVDACASDEDHFDEQQCQAMAARFVRNGTWVVPTIAGLYQYKVPPRVFAERLGYWLDSVDATTYLRFRLDSAASWLRLEPVRRAWRAGMPMLAGTDASPFFPTLVPGFSLHDELAAFVEAGLTPLEAVQTATLNPAKFFGATDSLGSIAPGKLADLVLLDADPLADIGHTTKIRAVVANGRYFDRTALDALLAGVKRGAASAAKAP